MRSRAFVRHREQNCGARFQPRRKQRSAQRPPSRSLTRSMYSPLKTPHFLIATQMESGNLITYRKHSIAALSNRYTSALPVPRFSDSHFGISAVHDRAHPFLPVTLVKQCATPIFEFPFSIFASPSPVHPCELKMTQLIENKRPRPFQPGTLDEPTRVVVPSDQREPRDRCRLRMLHEN